MGALVGAIYIMYSWQLLWGILISYSYAPANVIPKIKIHIEILSPAVCQ